jgi:hypothetical protein
MYEITFIDKSFNRDAAGNYSISLQVNTNGLSYCIYDKITGAYNMFRKHRFEHIILQGDLIRSVEEVFTNDETLGLPFHKVKFVGYTQRATLVPAEFFDRSNLHKYLSFNHGDDSGVSVFSNNIATSGIFNVFAISDELVSLVTKHFGKAEFMNQSTPFLRHITKQHQSSADPCVFLSLNHDFFDIACTAENRLLLYNTFQYAGENDLLYYILFVYHRIGFDVQKIPLKISGESSSKLSYWDLIRQYVSDTVYDEPAGIPGLAPGLKQLVTCKFLNLLNVQMCELSEENSADAE